MRILHLADLHLGKRLGDQSLEADQQYILEQILQLIPTHAVDAVVIAGDVYDKALPPISAVNLLNRFLTKLHGLGVKVLLISGNHDSPERLDFASSLLAEQGVYLAGSFGGRLRRVTLTDAFGPVDFDLLPFIRPADVKEDPEERLTYQQAVERVLAKDPPDPARRSVLVCHQFVTRGGERPEPLDSECFAVGGVDNMDARIFSAYDYVALGHLHNPRPVGRETLRYAGTPLKYSFSADEQDKSVTLVELNEKGDIRISLLPLIPLHPVKIIRGRLAELLAPETVAEAGADSYVKAVITDEEQILDVRARLEAVYSHVLQYSFDNLRSRGLGNPLTAQGEDPAKRDKLAVFADFYRLQRGGQELSPAAEQVVRQLFAALEEERQ